jgi:hypothetical protein
VVHGIKIVASQSFLGGSIATYTISVGTSSTPALLSSPFSVFGAPLSTNFQLSNNFYAFDESNSTTIVAQAVCTGDVLANAIQGSVDIYALLSIAF